MHLTGFVFGIRVNKSFYIEDKLGAITDFILYTNGSEFNPSLFPQVQEHAGMKILVSDKTNNKFTINHSDFIFEYNVKNDFDSEFSKYLASYSDIISKQLFKKFGICNIMRFGFIIKAVADEKEELASNIEKLICQSYNDYDGDSLSFRFNVKVKRPLRIKDQVTEDFDNTIVTYDRASQGMPIMISADYQKYFRPELGNITEATQSFDTFCRNCYSQYKLKYCK